MTPLLTIAIFSIALVVVYLFRHEMLWIARTIAAGVLDFRARLKEIDDELWRR